ncbi:hypothetical protein KBB96_05135 [Luteolibacter ambystomatis]|uniref:Uncharacterized protein n=2 Tax=Luteolibacter ambystomatis TaxID=2824561 RepID=A0A975J1I9_9BACT|nr:hypothetical protein [Luteolibacter ambystomatis]QUE52277.1 hypothetical protein KBB96_05135 [Luteolibacter ambystomatis]
MDNSQHTGLLTLFSSFFDWLCQGTTIGEQEFGRATSSRGTDVATFRSGFLNRIGKAFGIGDSYGFSDQVVEGEVIAKEAAKKIGCEDGIVPEKDMGRFLDAEKELKAEMWKLTRQLRQRMGEVTGAGIDANYSSMLQSDARMTAIISEAVADGVPATLIDNVKQTLTNDQNRVMQSNAEILKNMSFRR